MADGEPIRMQIKGLMLDPSSKLPIVILRDDDSRYLLPIWIGVFEANAIALRVEQIETPRPMTHDLLKAALTEVGVEVEKVLISDLQENTFYALIYLRHNGEQLTLDSRPSDAIALALRAEAPIFVLPKVLKNARSLDMSQSLEDDDRMKKWLEEVDPEDLGKYKM
jgi:bifunctional DNase/RNase